MNALVLAVVIAIIVEALIEYAKTIGKAVMNKQYKTAATQLAAIAIGVGLCAAADVDLFAALGIVFSIKAIGVVLTGIFASRGANFVSDIAKRIQSVISGELVLSDAIEVNADKK